MSLDIVKCPHCDYVYRTDIEKVVKDGKTVVVKGPYGQDKIKPNKEMYIDLKCPNCDREFEWRVT